MLLVVNHTGFNVEECVHAATPILARAQHRQEEEHQAERYSTMTHENGVARTSA